MVDEHAFQDHLLIVLSERPEAVPGQDRRVVALSTWRVTDPMAQHALIRAGIGWGSLPASLVDGDLAAGRLLHLGGTGDSRFRQAFQFGVVVAYRRDEPLGPAGRWLFDRLSRQTS